MTPIVPTPSAEPASALDNPYLQGNFAPVAKESTLVEKELRVHGTIPKGLHGTLLRNGPNPAGEIADPNKHHWFVGDAMLHAVRFEDGRALSYRNRWVRTSRVEEKIGLTAAPKSPHETPIQGSGAVNVIEHAGRVLALGEVGLPYQMTRGLDTVGQYDFAEKLRSNMTAHPKIDPVTGELFFFGYDFGEVSLRYHVADKTGALVKTLELATKAPVMMHDFAITATRTVFMDLPVVFDLDMVANGYTMPFRWDDNYGARIGVMRRDGDGKDLKWIEIPACFIFHVYNAYDDGERIVLDAVEHDRTFVGDGMLTDRNYAVPRCVRYVID
ncbi:MAG TPA: carotenoid oxygenase family protein, partial [Polyangiales bacterium]|nr:carotenoid oxygenase family protein [Polyangiales bacterium]